MAIRNYVVNNKKKSACIFLAALFLIVAIFGIIWVNNTKAGVFIKDGDENVQIYEIKVLEIVAQNGQQVVGYTVKGQEPITKEAIEAYKGTVDVIEDVTAFKNVTGYDVTKKQNTDGTFSYKVNGSILNNTFNENVLGDSMAAGEIKVKAVQAADLTTTDVKWADLIYINSNDYDSNLLYYYDQFMNNGKAGVEPGDCGPTFAGNMLDVELYTEIARKKICLAAGDSVQADLLTIDDFEILGLNKEIFDGNIDLYFDDVKAGLAALDYDSLNGKNETESIELIKNALTTINAESRQKSVNYIINRVGKKIETVEDKAEFIGHLQKVTYKSFNEHNSEQYIAQFNARRVAIAESQIETLIVASVNNTVGTATLNNMLAVKEKVNLYFEENPEAEENLDYGLTDEEFQALRDYFYVVNVNGVYDYLIDVYVSDFLASSFEFTEASYEAIEELITLENDLLYDDNLYLLASCVGDEEAIATVEANAPVLFDIITTYKDGITDYNGNNIEEYIEALKELTDVNVFMTEVEDEIFVDVEKINQFLVDVNNKKLSQGEIVVKSCDISWRNALEIYKSAMSEDVALMYNTQLLTADNTKIGDFNADLSQTTEVDTIDNTNNMYKMLLISRQIRYTYYENTLANLISSEGVYYPEGKGADGQFIGDGINSWNKETFGTDYVLSNGSVNYAKYHEPDVVGQTYGDDGTAGLNTNYVYRKIYSFTGDQFFGGYKFVTEQDNGNANNYSVVLTANATYSDASGKYFVVDTRASNVCNDYNLYAHFWNNSGDYQTKFVPCTKLGNYQFLVNVPDGYSKVIFTKEENFNNQTKDINIPSDFNGKTYAIYDGYDNDNNKDALSTNYMIVNMGDNYYQGNWNLVNSNRIYSHFWKNNGKEFSLKFVNVNVYEYAKFLLVMPEGYDRVLFASNESYSNKSSNIDIKHINGKANGATYRLTNSGGYDWWGNFVESSISLNKDSDGNSTSISPYSIKIDNFKSNDVVEFLGSMDMTFTYSGMSSVEYSINGGTAVSVANGQKVKLGSNLKGGESAKISVTYTPSGRQAITVTTTIMKQEVKPALNYLSTMTATNSAVLGNDPSLDGTINSQIANTTKGAIIRYLLGVTVNVGNYPINVLDIEPAASVSTFGSYDGALKIAKYLGIDATADGMTKDNYTEFINVRSMSVKEFDTRNDQLTTTYDIIYFGTDTGYMRLNSNGRTFYNDSSMTGLIYTGIGDEFGVPIEQMGTLACDYTKVDDYSKWNTDHKTEYKYWVDYYTDGFRGQTEGTNWALSGGIRDKSTDSNQVYYKLRDASGSSRILGNDITVRKYNELMEYLEAGYPILFADILFDCDSADYVDYNASVSKDKWRYVATNSKLYHFIVDAKKLGYDQTTGQYDGIKRDINGNVVIDEEGNPVVAFKDGKAYPSIIKVSTAETGKNPESLIGLEKLNGGLSYAYKRTSIVNFSFDPKNGPTQYKSSVNSRKIGKTIEYGSQESKTYKITLDVKSKISKDELDRDYGYQMYVDKSGVGKFVEDDTLELDPNVKYILTEDQKYVSKVEISGLWPGDMEGFMPWRVEAYKKSNPELKFSYTGYSAFKSKDKRDVYVLWVRTEYSSNNPYNLDFSKGVETYLNDINDYNIHLISMSYTEFKDMYKNYSSYASPDFEYTKETSLLKVNTVVKYLLDKYGTNYTINKVNLNHSASNKKGRDDNGELLPDELEFNMLVLGFSDSYVGEDINSIQALKNIEYFVNAGYSLLYSHDSSSYMTSFMRYRDSSTNNNYEINYSHNWGRYTTGFMREILGQDTFGVNQRGDKLTDSVVAARKYLDTTNPTKFRGITELTMFKYDTRSHKCNIYSTEKYGTSGAGYSDWCHTARVMRTNEGQITDYPFVLPENLSVSKTHEQYSTLNLEDENTTVWYVLDDDGKQTTSNNPRFYTFTKGDGANNYYIYSNGNITYTGAGHSGIGTSTDEMRLFVNTVVAALKAGNYAPTVEITNAYNKSNDTTNYINYYKDPDGVLSTGVLVSFRASDYDYKEGFKAFSTFKMFADVNGNGTYEEGTDYLLNDPNADYNDVNNDGIYIENVDEKGTLLPGSDILDTKVLFTSKLYDLDGTRRANLVGNKMFNKREYSVFMTNDLINQCLSYAMSKNSSITSLNDLQFVVYIEDLGYKKSINPTPAPGSAIFKLNEKAPAQMFNLN